MAGRAASLVLTLSFTCFACSDSPPSLEGSTSADSESESESGTPTETSTSGQGEESGETGGGPVSCADQPGPWDYGYSIPKHEHFPGDAQAGLDALLEES